VISLETLHLLRPAVKLLLAAAPSPLCLFVYRSTFLEPCWPYRMTFVSHHIICLRSIVGPRPDSIISFPTSAALSMPFSDTTYLFFLFYIYLLQPLTRASLWWWESSFASFDCIS